MRIDCYQRCNNTVGEPRNGAIDSQRSLMRSLVTDDHKKVKPFHCVTYLFIQCSHLNEDIFRFNSKSKLLPKQGFIFQNFCDVIKHDLRQTRPDIWFFLWLRKATEADEALSLLSTYIGKPFGFLYGIVLFLCVILSAHFCRYRGFGHYRK